jgi:hypothetical protein
MVVPEASLDVNEPEHPSASAADAALGKAITAATAPVSTKKTARPLIVASHGASIIGGHLARY